MQWLTVDAGLFSPCLYGTARMVAPYPGPIRVGPRAWTSVIRGLPASDFWKAAPSTKAAKGKPGLPAAGNRRKNGFPIPWAELVFADGGVAHRASQEGSPAVAGFIYVTLASLAARVTVRTPQTRSCQTAMSGSFR